MTNPVTLTLDTSEAERLLHFARIYDTAMNAPAPETFDAMLQWAYARQAAQAEFSRFARELLRKKGTL